MFPGQPQDRLGGADRFDPRQLLGAATSACSERDRRKKQAAPGEITRPAASSSLTFGLRPWAQILDT
jgi:hypothetical protein